MYSKLAIGNIARITDAGNGWFPTVTHIGDNHFAMGNDINISGGYLEVVKLEEDIVIARYYASRPTEASQNKEATYIRVYKNGFLKMGWKFIFNEQYNYRSNNRDD